MACEVCQHCQEPLKEDFSMREGYSYHRTCHKCYVCSETNLRNAEVFKGVIFCSSCSHRIFQGCSTVRNTKNTRKNRRSKDKRRPNGILELAHLGVTTSSSNENIYQKNMQKKSAEMGMTTEVTQELLKQMNCPVYEHKSHKKNARPIPEPIDKKNKIPCSDLRIAELGVSTEIANMALKHKSELPVIIHESRMRNKRMTSRRSFYNEQSHSGYYDAKWTNSYVSSQPGSIPWIDRSVRSILKIPFVAFKKNILDRSSIIHFSKKNGSIAKKIRVLFHRDVVEHQSHGLRRLYSTIHRKKTPHRLGWPDLVANASRDSRKHMCKHHATHSYRCMRAQTMRLAGPTHSELAVFVKKTKNMLAPEVLRRIKHKKYAMTMSQACGTSLAGSSK